MSDKPDGGAAFPAPTTATWTPYPSTTGAGGGGGGGGYYQSVPQPGMTLRQWYAGIALQGFATKHGQNICGPNVSVSNVSKMAFEAADAMIAEGEK